MKFGLEHSDDSQEEDLASSLPRELPVKRFGSPLSPSSLPSPPALTARSTQDGTTSTRTIRAPSYPLHLSPQQQQTV